MESVVVDHGSSRNVLSDCISRVTMIDGDSYIYMFSFISTEVRKQMGAYMERKRLVWEAMEGSR